VVTSLIPPSSALRGVAQSLQGIDEGHRTPQAVIPILKELGLRKATYQEYTTWIKEEKGGVATNKERLLATPARW
jgi:hypothetical protein